MGSYACFQRFWLGAAMEPAGGYLFATSDIVAAKVTATVLQFLTVILPVAAAEIGFAATSRSPGWIG